MVEILKNENFNELAGSGLVLIDFNAKWCAPCRVMVPVMDTLSAKYAGECKIFSVDVDESYELAYKYKVESIPSFIVLRNGKQAERIVGAHTLAEMDTVIARHVAKK